MSKDYYPQEPIKGTCSRVICYMYRVLFCFSYLYLKLLFFEKGGLIVSKFSYFTFLMSFMIIFVNNSSRVETSISLMYMLFHRGIIWILPLGLSNVATSLAQRWV